MATDIGVDRRRGRRKKRGVVGWMNRLPGDERERERGWRIGPRQQRTTRRRWREEEGEFSFVRVRRGDGRLCDALIILKQSLAGRPCIVQKSRGNSEKEEGWVGGRSVCPFVVWLANDTRVSPPSPRRCFYLAFTKSREQLGFSID